MKHSKFKIVAGQQHWMWVGTSITVLAALAGCKQIASDAAALPGLQMVELAGGTFQMGLAGEPKAEPVHAVTIKPFKMSAHEITVAEFREFVTQAKYKPTAVSGAGGTYGCRVLNSGSGRPGHRESANWQDPAFPQTDQHPVVCVSYYDAQAFITWLNKKTKRKFRLPTEAEWEYAAQAGANTRFPWGDDAEQVCKYENLSDNTPNPLATADDKAVTRSNTSPADVGAGGPPDVMSAGGSAMPTQMCTDGYFYTAPVGTFAANAFGLHDMLGNAREWVSDCWHANYQGAPSDGSSWKTQCSEAQVTARGGSWTFVLDATAFNRGGADPYESSDNMGFRLAEDL